MNNRNPILLVEDDSIDAMMVERALEELKVTNELIHKQNGEEALNYLKDNSQTRPSIILLDLNMPRMGGLEFLEIVKSDSQLKSIPIIVLSTSSENQDLLASFKHSAACYIVKPVDYHEFVGSMELISDFWSHNDSPH